jgi:Dolichyl-phosphate-mannose-protein mannosyltransferase
MPGSFVGHLRSRLAVHDRCDLATALLLGTLLVVALATIGDYAISNDEEVQQRYGELIIAWYASGFTDQTLFHFKNLYLYGGLFDIVATLLDRVLPFDLYTVRHVLSALTGVAGVGATAATARLIAGPRAGLIAAAALAVCGVWYGGMFNHTKDVPFAAAMIGATYFLLRTARDLPRPRVRDVIGFGVLLGAALGLRAMALLVPCYAGLVILAQAWALDGATRQERGRFVVASLLRLLPAFAIGYAIMIASWPWAALDLFNPVRAIFSFAHFHYEIRTLLDGDVYLMNEVPRWYVPTYVLVKLPLLLFAGALCALVTVAWPRPFSADVARRGSVALLAFTAAFPLLCEVAFRGPAFTGMRHFIFIVPPLAVLAGIGFDAVLAALSRIGVAATATATVVLSAAIVWNAAVLVRLHPYEYLFFSPLVGGLEGAARRYDTDYWVNIMPEAVERLTQYVRTTDGRAPPRHTVAVCAERISFEHEAGDRFAWSNQWLQADFFIAPTHMNCDRVLKGRTAFTIKRLGVVIGVVQDLRGLTASERGLAPELARK